MKRIISMIVVVAMFFCICPAAFSATEENMLILGDVNFDSKVNIKDATDIRKHLAKVFEFTYEQLLCSDCDADLKVNIKDATWIQKFIAEIDCPYPIGEMLSDYQPDDSTPTDVVTTAVPEDIFTTESVTESIITLATDAVETTITQVPTTITEVPTTGYVEPSDIAVSSLATDPTEEVTTTNPDNGIELPDDEFETSSIVETEGLTETVAEYNPVKPDTNITIYFSNNKKWATVNAYVYNEAESAELKSWPGTAMTYLTTNDMGEEVYKMDVDVSKYNRIVFNNGRGQTLNAALTVASSGFFITRDTPKQAMQLGVYAYGTDDYGEKTTVKLKYPTGYDKPIEIWTPAGYDPLDTSKKYSVIYLLDGQNQFDDSDTYEGGWGSDEVITALMQNGGDGFILVGIDNSTFRDNELTPDIGDVIPGYANQGFENGTGQRFASFVADVVVPYVESNYNVYTDAAHCAIVGSSSGGIEAFYIGMEHMDEFGRIGALSPAFLLFDKATWNEYFKKFDFTKNETPRIYFYNGGGDSLEQELLPSAEGMMDWLADLGYNKDKMTFVYDEKNQHNEAAWRNIMPEVVSWLFELQ